jgi:hypothetical protein
MRTAYQHPEQTPSWALGLDDRPRGVADFARVPVLLWCAGNWQELYGRARQWMK